ncbi:MAG: undecaprenyl-phosphate glucose phosphotransferase, partial [Methylobacter sp.]
MAGLVLRRWSSRAVIVGLSDISRKLTHQFKRNPLLRVGCMGFFDDRWSERLPEDKQCQPRLGSIASTAAFVKAYNVQHIYIALPLSAQPRILALLDDLRDTTASIYFVPDLASFDLIQANISIIDGIPIVAVCESPFVGINSIIKRVSDVIISLLILLV